MAMQARLEGNCILLDLARPPWRQVPVIVETMATVNASQPHIYAINMHALASLLLVNQAEDYPHSSEKMANAALQPCGNNLVNPGKA